MADTLQSSLSRIAGAETLPRPDILPEIEKCIVDSCGGCTEAGMFLSFKPACDSFVLKRGYFTNAISTKILFAIPYID